jgi:hypothetical protein
MGHLTLTQDKFKTVEIWLKDKFERVGEEKVDVR